MGYLEKILAWFYPPHCILCGRLLKIGKEEILCKGCEIELPWNNGPVCQKCGRPMYVSMPYCKRCQEEGFAFEKGIAVFPYDKMRKTIAHMKYKGWKRDAVPLGNLMGEYLLTYYADWIPEIDMILPIPMYWKKEKKRGFNQAALLAEELAKRIQKPCSSGYLLRSRETIPQSRLTAQERKQNVKDAFVLERPEEIVGKTILLVDDIFTTGITIHTCAELLQGYGAKKVLFFTLSIVERE